MSPANLIFSSTLKLFFFSLFQWSRRLSRRSSQFRSKAVRDTDLLSISIGFPRANQVRYRRRGHLLFFWFNTYGFAYLQRTSPMSDVRRVDRIGKGSLQFRGPRHARARRQGPPDESEARIVDESKQRRQGVEESSQRLSRLPRSIASTIRRRVWRRRSTADEQRARHASHIKRRLRRLRRAGATATE